MDMQCPICDAEFLSKYDLLDQGLLLEEWGACPQCGQYIYNFAFGTTEVRIGSDIFLWTHNDDPTESANMSRAASLKTCQVRAQYNKLENYGHG